MKSSLPADHIIPTTTAPEKSSRKKERKKAPRCNDKKNLNLRAEINHKMAVLRTLGTSKERLL